MIHASFHILIFLLFFCPLNIFGQDNSTIFPLSGENHSSKVEFTENKGQWNSTIIFKTDVPSGALFLEKNGFTYNFFHPEDLKKMHTPAPGKKKESTTLRAHAIRSEFINANADPVLSGHDEYPDYRNYFIGSNPSGWTSNVKAFRQVSYTNLYEGIGLQIYHDGKNLKYDLVADAGADPSVISMKITGSDKIFLKDGSLHIVTSVNELIEQKPYAYQPTSKGNKEVVCSFILEGDEVKYFFPGGFDPDLPLIIDPALVFSTFTGSTADNWGFTATYDYSDNGYTAGVVFSTGYPVTTGAYDITFNGPGGFGSEPIDVADIAIMKFNDKGQRLYATYLGGATNGEKPHSLVCTQNDELIVFGTTRSTDFPVAANAYDLSHNGGIDIFICKFNSSGTALLASTFMGGSGDDGDNSEFFTAAPFTNPLHYNYGDESRGDVIADANGNVTVASCTQSANFPVTAGAIQAIFQGGVQDGCVFKLTGDFSQLTWSTYLGAGAQDACYSIASDNTGGVYVAGGTNSANFPATAGAVYTTFRGDRDGFIAHLNSTGTALIASTYFGSAAYDQTYMVQLDVNGDVYVAGQTGAAGNTFITSANYFVPGGGQFISKLNPALNTLVLSTAFGSGTGGPDISPTAFLVDNCGRLYLAGWGSPGLSPQLNGTSGLPVTGGAYQSNTDGEDFYIIVLEKNANSLLYATYMGGAFNIGEHVDGGTSRFDKQGRVYQAVCGGCGAFSDFPTTPGVWSNTNNSANCNNVLFRFDFEYGVIANAGNDVTICAGQTVSIGAPPDSGSVYTWSPSSGLSNPSIANPTVTPTQTTTYTVSVTNVNGCSGIDSVKITVVSNMIVAAGPDTSVCNGGTVQLNANAPGATAYAWSPSSGLSCTACQNPVASITSSNTYIVTVSNGYCSGKDTVILTVSTPPVASVDGPDSLCTNYETPVVFTGTAPPGAYYVWSVDGVPVIPGSGPDLGTVLITWVTAGIKNVKVSVTAAGCPPSSDSLNIRVIDCSIRVPNIMVPDGDGKNDVFLVKGLEKHPNSRLLIYNRWGLKIYESSDYKNDWKGTHNGKEIPDGVYYYILMLKDGSEDHGFVTLIRNQ